MRGGAIFAFSNKKRTHLRILYFDGMVLWLMTKRQEKGTFFWPKGGAETGQVGLKLAPEAFALLTDGIDMHGAGLRGWLPRAHLLSLC